MKLTAFFALWHLGDGNYPPFHKGQLVNLSFQLFPTNIEKLTLKTAEYFEHLGDAVYRFSSKVLHNYGDDNYPFIVVQANNFRFYIDDALAKGLNEGDRLVGEGSLGLDTYYWVESLDRLDHPPDLFYNLEVKRIRKIYDPYIVQFLASPPERGEEDIDDMDALNETGESVLQGAADCIIDFDSEGHEDKNIPRTFQ
jgi:hypothetical protein